MSSTNRGAERIENDVYPTPAWCVHRLLESCALPGGRWLEPAAGDGAIIRAVNERRADVEWSATELRKDACRTLVNHGIKAAHCADFLTQDMYDGPYWNVIITNPPYSLSLEFVKKSMFLADNVAMLLRLNWLGSESRSDFLRANEPGVYVLPNRPSFVRGKTDSCEYAWLVWGPAAANGIHILASTPRSERARKLPAEVSP